MNDHLKTRIVGKLDTLSDDIGRQVLDYLEFLESKYNRSTRTPSTVQRITENLEERIGGVRLSDVAAKGTAHVMDAAGKLMEGLAAASHVIAEELEGPASQRDADADQSAASEREAAAGPETASDDGSRPVPQPEPPPSA